MMKWLVKELATFSWNCLLVTRYTKFLSFFHGESQRTWRMDLINVMYVTHEALRISFGIKILYLP